MKKGKTSVFRKIIGILIAVILLSGVCAIAVHTQLDDVTIKLQNGCEMTVLTSHTKVSEILEENKIVLKEDEKVTPGLEENIVPGQEIKITNKSAQEIKIAQVSEDGAQTSIDELLENYSPITEKYITIQETIPFETVTKKTTEDTEDTVNKVLQEGVEGIKQTTYKIKYQNNQEIERVKVSEEVITEPIEQIVQVNKKSETTSRSSSPRASEHSTTAVIGGETYKITAYCSCAKCCGKSNGITAVGTYASAGRTVAAPARFAFGTQLNIGGHIYTVEDRGGAINGNKIDIYVNSHEEALQWGVRYLPVSVVE